MQSMGESVDDLPEEERPSPLSVMEEVFRYLGAAPDRLPRFKQDWRKIGGELTAPEFMYLISLHMGDSELTRFHGKHLVTALIQLHANVDYMDSNADGSIGWDAFQQHLIRTATTSPERQVGNEDEPIPKMIRLPLALVGPEYAPGPSRTIIEAMVVLDAPLELLFCEKVPQLGNDGHVKSKYLATPAEAAETFTRRLSLWRLAGGLLTRLRVIAEHSGVLSCATILESNYSGVSTTTTLVVACDKPGAEVWSITVTGRIVVAKSERSLVTERPLLCLGHETIGRDHRRQLFGGSVDGTVVVWDAETWHVRQVIMAHDGAVSGLQLLNVVDQLVTVSHDYTLRLWDVSDEPATLQPSGGDRWHSRSVVGIVYSQVHQLIATASDDRTAVVINPVLSERLCSLVGHSYPIVSVALTPDAIITVDARLHVRVWEMVSLMCVQTFRISPEGMPVGDMTLTAAVTLRGGPPRMLALADGEFHLFGADDAARSKRDPPSALLYSRKRLRVISAVGDTLRVWDARTGALVRTLRGQTETAISAVCLDHTEFNCLVGEQSGRVTQFNLASGLLVRPLPSHKSEIIGLALIWSAAACKMRTAVAGRPTAKQTREEVVHGALVVSASADRVLHVSSVRQGSLLATFQIGNGDLSSLATSANTGLVAAGSSTGALSLWKLIEASAIRHDSRCEGHTAEVTGLAFLADRLLLVSADAETEMVLWRVAPLKCTPLCRWWHRSANGPINSPISHSVVTALTYEADRHMLLTGDETGSINVWRLSQLEPAQELDVAGAQRQGESRAARAATSLEAIDVSEIVPVALWVGHGDGVSAMVDISGRAMESGSQRCLGLLSAGRDANIMAWLIDGGSPESGRETNLCGRLTAGWALPLDRTPMLDEEERRRAHSIAELQKFQPPAGMATKDETRHLLHQIIGNAGKRSAAERKEKRGVARQIARPTSSTDQPSCDPREAKGHVNKVT